MNIPRELEAYLLAKMSMLCGGKAQNVIVPMADKIIGEIGIFDMATPFTKVVSALGDGAVGPRRIIEDASESLRVSVEHRYSLSHWPDFEFLILESEEGYAWGQTFVRRTGMAIPRVQGIADLSQWSHVESEVRAVLGQPTHSESWWPWESSVYRTGDGEFGLCYVYGLLQKIQAIGRSESRPL